MLLGVVPSEFTKLTVTGMKLVTLFRKCRILLWVDNLASIYKVNQSEIVFLRKIELPHDIKDVVQIREEVYLIGVSGSLRILREDERGKIVAEEHYQQPGCLGLAGTVCGRVTATREDDDVLVHVNCFNRKNVLTIRLRDKALQGREDICSLAAFSYESLSADLRCVLTQDTSRLGDFVFIALGNGNVYHFRTLRDEDGRLRGPPRLLYNDATGLGDLVNIVGCKLADDDRDITHLALLGRHSVRVISTHDRQPSFSKYHLPCAGRSLDMSIRGAVATADRSTVWHSAMAVKERGRVEAVSHPLMEADDALVCNVRDTAVVLSAGSFHSVRLDDAGAALPRRDAEDLRTLCATLADLERQLLPAQQLRERQVRESYARSVAARGRFLTRSLGFDVTVEDAIATVDENCRGDYMLRITLRNDTNVVFARQSWYLKVAISEGSDRVYSRTVQRSFQLPEDLHTLPLEIECPMKIKSDIYDVTVRCSLVLNVASTDGNRGRPPECPVVRMNPIRLDASHFLRPFLPSAALPPTLPPDLDALAEHDMFCRAAERSGVGADCRELMARRRSLVATTIHRGQLDLPDKPRGKALWERIAAHCHVDVIRFVVGSRKTETQELWSRVAGSPVALVRSRDRARLEVKSHDRRAMLFVKSALRDLFTPPTDRVLIDKQLLDDMKELAELAELAEQLRDLPDDEQTVLAAWRGLQDITLLLNHQTASIAR